MRDKCSSLAFPTIDLRQLLTSWDQCTVVTPGPVSAAVVQQMTQRDFDYAPVLLEAVPPGTWLEAVPRHTVLGLISRTRLAELAQTGQPLAADDPAILSREVNVQPSLDVLLDAMAEFRARLVTSEVNCEQYCYGIVTVSDLNKHPLRTVVYGILADLEMAVADLVRDRLGGSLDWIRKLDNEDSQARILGYWKLSKLNDVDTGPVTGATLSELLNAIGRLDEVRNALGFNTRSQWDAATGPLRKLRNRVMHPVRPLVEKPGECAKLREWLETTLELADGIREQLESRRAPRLKHC